jgi:GDP-L-fucose synthase
MEPNSKILVAGASGLVGSAIIRELIQKGYTSIAGTFSTRKPGPDLLLPDYYDLISSGSGVLRFSPHESRVTPCELHLHRVDLRSQEQTQELFQNIRPEYVFLAAARVGGIMANNTYRAEFLHDNLLITANVIHQSYLSGVKKLLNLGSSCIYPRDCPQPMKEEHLLTGPLEYTNEPYAIAKITGLKMCESYNLQYGANFISVMPTNLYGPGDNFDLEKSHVLPAMLRKIHLGKCLYQGDWNQIRADLRARPVNGVDGDAPEKSIVEVLSGHGIAASNLAFGTPVVTVRLWGTGRPMREFLWGQDMADACAFIMENIDFKDMVGDSREVRNTHVNLGSGFEISLADLAQKIKGVVGFNGEVNFDPAKPDGTPRKLTDVSRLHSLGWRHRTDLDEGLNKFYQWYRSSVYRYL